MPTICLAMMVKNESAIIERCLKAALPWIDSWLICDTGSTDGTQDIVRKCLKDIPGELVEVPWVDFGANRTQVIALARERADYLLLLDADLEISPGSALSISEFKEYLAADAYDLRYAGGLDYVNTRLVSTRHPWSYVGVTHEYITSPTATTYKELPSVRLIDHADGGNRSDKFQRDVRLLTEALARNPDDSRSAFYLGQSHKDLNQYKHAQSWYEYRLRFGGFDEERWYSMYQAARMANLAGDHWDEIVLPMFLKAYHYRPTRIEPVYEVVRHYREVGGHAEFGFLYAAIWGFGFRYPKEDRLFIDANIYRYLMPYEFAYAAWRIGKDELAGDTLEQLGRDSRGVFWMEPWVQKLRANIEGYAGITGGS